MVLEAELLKLGTQLWIMGHLLEIYVSYLTPRCRRVPWIASCMVKVTSVPNGRCLRQICTITALLLRPLPVRSMRIFAEL